jgi:hypothetical protein
MQDSPLEQFIVGVFLTLAGLAIIIFYKSIKERRDEWNAKDWPIGYGEMWTGKYTRGGLIFTYAVIILIGAVLLCVGITKIIDALTK